MKTSASTIAYLPDTRGVVLSRYGKGNRKIGDGVYTYSRRPGGAHTCPGATTECEAICYAKRIVGIVAVVHQQNTATDTVPPIPDDCRLMRLHIAGDFDSVTYIDAWIARLRERPDVTMWAYTRSWRVPALLPALERLRALPNVQLFASVDSSTPDLPPAGWRRAWIDGDPRAGRDTGENRVTTDGAMAYVCPEQTGRKRDCEDCGYCFHGRSHDVTFLRH